MTNFSKREFIFTGAMALTYIPNLSMGAATKSNAIANEIAKIEKTIPNSRLGVCIYNVNDKSIIGYRAHERFAMCSTFKLLLAAIILKEVDSGKFSLNQEIAISADGLKPYSDIVEKALLKGKITIYDAIKSSQENSDNISANALLKILGGPQIFTQKLRETGDKITRLDRIEPKMNLVKRDDILDTSTPYAFAKTTAFLLFGNYLSKQSNELLKNFTINTKTGTKRLRAGLGKKFIIGNKTGTGVSSDLPNKYNDVAIIYGPNKKQFIISSFFETDKYYENMRDEDQKILEEVGKIAKNFIAK